MIEHVAPFDKMSLCVAMLMRADVLGSDWCVSMLRSSVGGELTKKVISDLQNNCNTNLNAFYGM